jgi:AcrR family transcriptional regulator
VVDQVNSRTQRSRRAEKAAQTRRRIIDAATALFLERGYNATTIETIAERADVAVETVYSRFRNKANLLEAILEPTIVGSDDGRDIFDAPEIARIASSADHQAQIRQLAAFSRGILERSQQAHRILKSAAACDPKAAALQKRDTQRRVEGQRRYIDMLLQNGPLRPGLSRDDAAALYSALANPDNFAQLTRSQGWSPDRFQQWLEHAITRLFV